MKPIALRETSYSLPGQTGFYKGKVRDVYEVGDLLVMVASDRISAFDHVLTKAIPYKGQVLNQTASYFLNETAAIVPNWLIATPHPQVAIGHKCEPIRIEMVIRGYLAGHASREYKAGKRTICGVTMPDEMQEADKFPEPIITPTAKAAQGHDQDITREEIIRQGLVSEAVYVQLEDYTRKLFKAGTEMAAKQGLILVDTKYEFGLLDSKVILMDEIHTPDSSRYYYADGYAERQTQGKPQKQLSKEFVREWLMEQGFSGLEGQEQPEMDDSFVDTISARYIELFEQVTGLKFTHVNYSGRYNNEVEHSILQALRLLS
jgi:phosphoribosylaminoimidazole-succinocarboxamide synthase